MRETRETRFSCSSPHFYWLLLVIVKSIVSYQNMSSDRFGSKSDWSGPVRSRPDWSGPVRSGSVRTGPYYVLHIIITYNEYVDTDILCYRTTGTYPCIVLLLDYGTRY